MTCAWLPAQRAWNFLVAEEPVCRMKDMKTVSSNFMQLSLVFQASFMSSFYKDEPAASQNPAASSCICACAVLKSRIIAEIYVPDCFVMPISQDR